MSDQYFIELCKVPSGTGLQIHRGDPESPLVTATAALGREARVSGRSGTLGEIADRLLGADVRVLRTTFDERLQLDVGCYLYEQTLGQVKPELPSLEHDLRIHIVTDKERIAGLPWVLLARGGTFLSTIGASVALSRPGRRVASCILPPSPRILVAAPEPEGVSATGVDAHLEELELLLSAADRHFERGRHLQVASSWNEFRCILKDQQPDLLYYYGHGKGNTRTTHLVFADDANHRLDIAVVDLAQSLRELCKSFPVLAYINCCKGDSGGILGAGWQLGKIIPAVVTNRTTAFIDAARRQARRFWHAVLLDGHPPHQAVAETYAHLGDMGLGLRDPRWMTPVFHGHYDRWESHPPKTRRIDDLYWHVKLDRVSQFGQVVFQTQKMLLHRKPSALAYLWYGKEGQGGDLFHQRLKVELRDFLGENLLFEVRPIWPEELETPYRSFEDMICLAFKVDALDNIPGRVRAQTRGEGGRDTVVYVRHLPLHRGDVMAPRHLKLYLEWWDDVLTPLLAEAPAFGLLGISFVVSHPERFEKVLHKHALDTLELHRVVFHTLDALVELTPKDVHDFLITHNVVLPRARKDRIVAKILEETGGHYKMTLDALRDLVYRARDERDAEEDATRTDAEDEEW